MTLSDRIKILSQLGDRLSEFSEKDEAVFQMAYLKNKWFTTENIKKSIHNIRTYFLNTEALQSWVAKYNFGEQTPQTVGLIMAGNIPLVGFHDVLATFISGHKMMIKLSDKDQVLLPWILDLMKGIAPEVEQSYTFQERMANFDVVIATGSNNTARYFESYFSKYPHIIRKNRNAVAVLTGTESPKDLSDLGKDIFEYFGLGCRNVAKIYVPENFNFEILMEALHEYKDIILHNKYKNNFDYNYTLFILNKVQHYMNGCILVLEDDNIQSRIASLHYEKYSDKEDLKQKLTSKRTEIQCVVGAQPIEGFDVIPFGKSQQPRLDQYADGVDTLSFLTNL